MLRSTCSQSASTKYVAASESDLNASMPRRSISNLLEMIHKWTLRHHGCENFTDELPSFPDFLHCRPIWSRLRFGGYRKDPKVHPNRSLSLGNLKTRALSSKFAQFFLKFSLFLLSFEPTSKDICIINQRQNLSLSCLAVDVFTAGILSGSTVSPRYFHLGLQICLLIVQFLGT